MNTIEQLNNYRSVTSTPPTPDCIIAFAKVMGHERDSVESISVDEEDGTCRVTFYCSVRCCDQSESYDVPLSVLTAADVAKATLVWKLDRELKDAERTLSECKSSLAWSEKRVTELREQLSAAMGGG